jgi:hypothetical protein
VSKDRPAKCSIPSIITCSGPRVPECHLFGCSNQDNRYSHPSVIAINIYHIHFNPMATFSVFLSPPATMFLPRPFSPDQDTELLEPEFRDIPATPDSTESEDDTNFRDLSRFNDSPDSTSSNLDPLPPDVLAGLPEPTFRDVSLCFLLF